MRRRATGTPRTSHPRHTLPADSVFDDSPLEAEVIPTPIRWWDSHALWDGLRRNARSARRASLSFGVLAAVALFSGWAGWLVSELAHNDGSPRVIEIRAVRRVWTPPAK